MICGLPCWQVIQHFPPSVLALSIGPGCYCCKIATLPFEVLCMYCAFETWHHLILWSCRLDAHRSRHYGMQVALIMPTISYSIVVLVTLSHILRAAIPIS